MAAAEKLRFNLRAALAKPVQDIKDPAVLAQLEKRILDRVRKEAEQYEELRVKSWERARTTFIR